MSGSVLRGTSSATRTMGEREIAALRPATAPPVRQRKPAAPPREVTSGIVCFCGERFAEAQALEFMLHLRAEVGEILDWREQRLARQRERNRKREKDPEYRQRQLERRRERWKSDPAYREFELERNRRGHEANREQRNERKNERRRERRANDPAYRERETARQREWRARKKAEREVTP